MLDQLSFPLEDEKIKEMYHDKRTKLITFKKTDFNGLSTKPVVSRFFWPPDIPLVIISPTIVSAQISSPRI